MEARPPINSKIELDMNFAPGMNSGQDGLLWLRSIHKLHPGIPVVLVTAYADISLAVRGLKNGAADFVTKPWDNDELLRVVKDAIDKSRQIVPLEQVEQVKVCHDSSCKCSFHPNSS